MSRSKIAILVIVFLVLVSSVGYLTYLIQNGDDPLTLFDLRAAQEDDIEDPLLAQDVSGTPTPTVSFTSTSPTISAGGTSIAPSVSITTTISPSPTSTPTPTVEALMTITPTPTQITELPVSGITDYLDATILGGAVLILLAFVL